MNYRFVSFLSFLFFLSGCVSNAQMDKMNNGTTSALGKPLENFVTFFGEPHEKVQVGKRNRLTWISLNV